MLTIHLKDLEFHAFHGLHPEEALTGNLFSVSVDVEMRGEAPITSIEQTADYEKLYHIVHEKMLQREDLLEVLAQKIGEAILSTHINISTVSITILKKNPPIPNFQGNTGITLTLTRN